MYRKYMKIPRFKLFGALTSVLLILVVVSYFVRGRLKARAAEARLIELVKLSRKHDQENQEATENSVVLGFKKKYNAVQGSLHLTHAKPIYILDNMPYADIEYHFFRYLEQKKVTCDNDVRLGAQHDGGWNVCMTPPFQLHKPCLVYSFGIGQDWRFEDDLYDFYGCEIQAFDPSIGKKEHNRTDLMHFYPLGLADRNYVTDKGWPMKTFHQHLKNAGHLKRTIDYLKFDIENMEWDVLANILPDLRNVKQLGFELHLRSSPPVTEKKGPRLAQRNKRSIGKNSQNILDLQNKNSQNILELRNKAKPSELHHSTTTKNHSTHSYDIEPEVFIEKFRILRKLDDLGFAKFNYRMNPFGAYVSKETNFERSFNYELHYLNMDFVEVKHLKKDNKEVG